MTRVVNMSRRILAFGTLLMAFACAGSRAQTAAATPPPAPQDATPAANPSSPAPAGGSGCPMMSPGVKASVADTQGGVAITFQAPADRVDAVRADVRRMAENRGGMMASCPCHGAMGHHGGSPGMGMMQGMHVPAADARAEDVPGGARLVLTAKDPSEVDALRADVRDHVEHMNEGGCPMMHH